MVVVKKGQGESTEALIRKFSKKVLNEGILAELKKREFYQKPSLRKKLEREEARRGKKRW